MTSGEALSLVLSILVGFNVGALGAGGAITALPILVYVARFPVAEAVALSKIVVGATSLIAAFLHYRHGRFHGRAALLFAVAGTPAAFLGARLTHAVPQRLLMLIFAGLMLASGLAMLKRRPRPGAGGRRLVGRCLLAGAVAGFLTGFLGVGGGFVIVPSLMLFADLPTGTAVGTSVAIIALNAAVGLAGHFGEIALDWSYAGAFLGLSLLGTGAGIAVAGRLPGETLRRAFAFLLIALAATIAGLVALGVPLPGQAPAPRGGAEATFPRSGVAFPARRPHRLAP